MAKPAPVPAPKREEAPPPPQLQPQPPLRRAPLTLVGIAKRPEGWALVELDLEADDPRLRILHDRLPRANALEAAVLRHQRLYALEVTGRGRQR